MRIQLPRKTQTALLLGGGTILLLGAALLQSTVLWLMVLVAGMAALCFAQPALRGRRQNQHDCSQSLDRIKACAFQNNLLALNAAVEAARTESEAAADTVATTQKNRRLVADQLQRLENGNAPSPIDDRMMELTEKLSRANQTYADDKTDLAA